MSATSVFDSLALSSPREADVGLSWRDSDHDVSKLEEYDPENFCVEPPMASRRFWFEDGTVVIQVQNMLYKLYKGILTRQSNYFTENITAALQAPASRSSKKHSVQYGTPCLVGVGSELQPLILSVNKNDFELLLSYMFPEDYNSQNSLTVMEWATIAQISQKLQIHSVRTAAISNILKSASPSELIVLARKHCLPTCYTEGFRQLCHRESSMTLKEGEEIGLATVIKIAHVRDMLAKGSKWSEVLSIAVETEIMNAQEQS
ncbi:hypothetical protein ACEPAG_3144 [Sanghuangporus baumii]